MLKWNTLQVFEEILKRQGMQDMMHQVVFAHFCTKEEKVAPCIAD